MKPLCVLLFAFALTQIVHAQQKPAPKESFIPENWTLIEETSGDLNKDSLNDVAMIVEYAGDELEGERPRNLIILFLDKATRNYTLAATAEHVILDSQSGGTMGDPLDKFEIKGGVLRIDFSGGSREQWTTTHRYRYTSNSYFRVIGATYKVVDGTVTTTYDYNLSNNSEVITIRDSRNKSNNTTLNIKTPLRPINMTEFEPDAIWALLIRDFPKQVSKCTLQDAGSGDCFHLGFDCGDFGNAKVFLDEASAKLWSSLAISNENDETIVNPAYKGKTFQITYITNKGVRCEPQGEDEYQIVIGLKLIP
ncbi:MAG: hypothetical protein U0U09_04390 [Cyclobacteriaceae bacterium]